MEKIPQSVLYDKEKKQLTLTGTLLIIFLMERLLNNQPVPKIKYMKEIIDYNK